MVEMELMGKVEIHMGQPALEAAAAAVGVAPERVH